MIINLMTLLRVIFLILILITPLKANTIYNLIKIPNLEIYDLKTSNNLKYFYSLKPFRLGIQKNIKCLNPDKELLDLKYKIIRKNLDIYKSNFLKKINLKYVVLCENLSISEINTAGIPDVQTKTLILDIGFNDKYFERAIHHEIFHLIKDSNKNLFDESIWSRFNDEKFNYAECSTCTDKLNLDTYKKTNGFFSEYSKSTASEDMAEVFSHLLIGEKAKQDNILENKESFIKSNILRISDTFKF